MRFEYISHGFRATEGSGEPVHPYRRTRAFTSSTHNTYYQLLFILTASLHVA